MGKMGESAICEQCGKGFVRTNGNQRFCSLKCRQAFNNGIARKDLDIEGSGEWAICHWCGAYFQRKPKTRQTYCSPECKADADKRNKGLRKWKAHRKKNGLAEGEKPPKVEKKDGFTWDEISAVLGEFGISSYGRAVEILEQRKKEAEEKELAEAFEAEKEKKDD